MLTHRGFKDASHVECRLDAESDVPPKPAELEPILRCNHDRQGPAR